jgi:putative CocE/NonD family hydrolase
MVACNTVVAGCTANNGHCLAVSLYLNHERQLSRERPVMREATLSYRVDPDHPVPTIGGALTSGAPVFAGGAFDQRERPDFFGTRGNNQPLAEREDVLSFQTPPLTEDLIIAGPLYIELWIESDAPDTDFTAKLVDIYPPSAHYPDGYAMNITDGIHRSRYRDSWENPEPLQPGKRVKVVIEPFATCNVFKRGHRLRLDIASSNFPRFDVNPNSGESRGSGTKQTHRHQHRAPEPGLCLPAGADDAPGRGIAGPGASAGRLRLSH